MKTGLLLALVLASLGRPAFGSASGANPVRRVVTMLQTMAQKVEAEGKKEEQLYDQYMCYCKSSGSSLQESIAAAEGKIPQVDAALEEAKSTKARLEEELKQHKVSRDAAKGAIAEAEAIRAKEAEEFAEESSELSTNVAALTKAIDALQKGMAGGAFLQSSSASVLRRLASNSEAIDSSERETVMAFLDGTSGEGYAPQSGEITGILIEMKDEMSKDLSGITAEEEKAKEGSAALIAAKEKEIAAATEAIESKSTRVGNLGVEIAQMANDLEDTGAALAEDQAFFKDMEKNCDTKKAEWDEVTKMRAEELVAISETIKVLNDDDALELFKKTLPSPSLIQTASNNMQAKVKALDMLKGVRSEHPKEKAALDLIVMGLSGHKIKFDKVMKLIDDLVVTLEKQQQDDDHKKEYCEKQFDVSDDSKKDLEKKISDLDLSVDDLKESIATFTSDIKALTDGITALDKEVAEGTEQRKEEHEAYLELIKSDSAAKELLAIAKNRLNKFYNPKLYKAPPKQVLTREEEIGVNFGMDAPTTPAPGGIADTGVMALVQVNAHSHGVAAPPPAPESFAPYAKKAEMSNGVISMLDLLVADLAKEMTEAATEEKNAQAEYEKFMSDAAAKRALDSKTISDKAGAKAQAEVELEKAKDSTSAKKSELMATEEYISTLHGDCDWLLKNFDLRKSARAGEVDSLKAAKAVLAGADYSLIQTRRIRSLRDV